MWVPYLLKTPCSYGQRQVGAWFGSGVGFLAVATLCGMCPGTDRGADQQEDPCPVKHNPCGLRWSEGNFGALSVKVCSLGSAILYKQGLIPKVYTPGWQQRERSGLWSPPSPWLLTSFAQCTGVLSDVRQANVNKDWRIGRTLMLHPLAVVLMGLCVWVRAQTCRKVNSHYHYKHNSIHKGGINMSFTPSLQQFDIYQLTVLYLQMVSFCTLNLCLYISCELVYHSDM